MTKSRSLLTRHDLAFLRAQLPPEAWMPARRKLRLLSAHAGVVAVGYLLMRQVAVWPWGVLLGVVAGHSVAVVGLLSHELSHGSITRGARATKWLERLFWSFLFVSPTMWRRIHNQVHHAHYNRAADTDRKFFWHEKTTCRLWYVHLTYPNRSALRWNPLVSLYMSMYFLRNTVALLGRGPWSRVLVPSAPPYHRGDRLRILVDLLCIGTVQTALWAESGSFTAYLGVTIVAQWTASTVVMSYIFTNHFLKPVELEHDALSGSTSVVVPPWIDRMHVHFSYHTEHHLFPAMNSDYYPVLSAVLKKWYGPRYHRVSIKDAWKGLWQQSPFVADPGSATHLDSGRGIQRQSSRRITSNTSHQGVTIMRAYHVAVSVLLLVAVGACAAPQSQGWSLVEAAREGDTAVVERLLAGGADPNERGALGATALMHAAAFGTADTVRVLLDAGADANATAAEGATALMWAAGDAEKVQLLLDRGAVVQVTSSSGATPVIGAARRGALESLRLLIAEGALEGLTGAEEAALLTAAYSSSHLGVRELLADAGLVANDIAQVVGASFSLGSGTLEGLQDFLDLGLDPDSTRPFVTVQIPLLGFAATGGQLDTVGLLLERGADPDGTATGGTTPIMMAAARERVDVVEALIDGGARLDATDAGGRSALDWALTRGETPVSQLLRSLGVAATAAPEAAPGEVVQQPRVTDDAIARAIDLLEPISPAFREYNTCISCHNQSIPALAMQAARDAGIAVDATMAAHPDRVTLESWEPAVFQNLLGDCSGGGFVQNTTYGLLAMAASGQPRTLTTDARVACLASRQEEDGSWTVGDVRPPLGGSALVFTVLSARALDQFTPPGLRTQMELRVDRARTFIRRTAPGDTQDMAFKLMGLVWLGGTPAEIAEQRSALLALQRENGGWGQEPSMSTDAYATGQALYALRLADRPPASEAYGRGVAYLLRTQREDGSWFVRSRGFPFQPYIDYGFPHGTNQFISAVATSWAVMALSGTP